MRYELRLRSWRILAKAMIVMALIINIRRNSVVKTGNQTEASSEVISFNKIQRSFCTDVFVYYSPAKSVNEKTNNNNNNSNNNNNNNNNNSISDRNRRFGASCAIIKVT